ncbi:MAG: type I DNA topoisomerase [Saprospiraceae bacterium]|nr:type I DNA topoisomerase [Saprospiraceae bacterium]
MAKNLLIVESPAKAKTIEKILGADFKVVSSMGHVRDLEKGGVGVDVKNNFKPNYAVTPDKIKLVNQLKAEARNSGEVWLATDEDREGEAISWHLCKVLGLDERITKRIVFREITKPAILNAVQNPRNVDLNLVDAQQARRVLDRLVGFELSELLWRKVKGGLSAGRVQSVAVKLVVEKEREIQKHDAKPYFKIDVQFDVKNSQDRLVKLKAESPERFDTEGGARGFLENCKSATYQIRKIDVKPTKRKPTAPFTTSTLQQEASRKLGFSVNRTMSNAQRLYEAGHISYMRTDSTNLSETALQAIAAEIETKFGAQYVQTRRFKTGKDAAQEAHEAIRPTYIEKVNVAQDRDEQRLYELIWKRTIASQMADAELEKTVVDVGISTQPTAKLIAEGEVIKFDGFLKVYIESKDDDDDDAKGVLPPLSVGQILTFDLMTATQKFTRPPARYTEAALVKDLEEKGIGRPSTYAPTISKIMEENRGYVEKVTREGLLRAFDVLTLDRTNKIATKNATETTGALKNHLVPTDMGMLVVDFLDKHFDNVMDYRFTAEVENQLDSVADGKLNWTKYLSGFYEPFHADVERTKVEAERMSGERALGHDPETGRTVLVRMGKFGAIAQIGAPDELAENEKPTYANLQKGQSIESISLVEALKLFELPKNVGSFEGSDVTIGIGRFGPYAKFGDVFVSIPRDEDPLSISLERAIELYEEKRTAEAPVFTYKSLPVTKGTGRFGPFIKYDGMFINVPRRFDLETLALDEAIELIEAKIEKEGNRYIHNWESEKISVENGRWSPMISFGKYKPFALKIEGRKATAEDAAKLTLEDVKKLIEAEIPNAFAKKEKKPAAAAKKPAPKKK